jgi:hypothetical protein
MNKLLLIIICVLFLLVLFLLIYIIRTLNKKNSNTIVSELQSKLDVSNNENEHLKALLNERIQELNDLRNAVPINISNNENVVNDNVGINDLESNIGPEILLTNVISSSSITQYFTVPSANGTFNPLHAKDFDDGSCYYKIEFSEPLTSSAGRLIYITSNRDRIAIHAYNDYLTKVCEILNFSDRYVAHNIQMISPGSVNLINDLWMIENKVKIRFI